MEVAAVDRRELELGHHLAAREPAPVQRLLCGGRPLHRRKLQVHKALRRGRPGQAAARSCTSARQSRPGRCRRRPFGSAGVAARASQLASQSGRIRCAPPAAAAAATSRRAEERLGGCGRRWRHCAGSPGRRFGLPERPRRVAGKVWGARLAVLVHVHMEDGAVLAALVLRLCLDVLLPLRVRLPAARPAVSAIAACPAHKRPPCAFWPLCPFC